MKPTPERVRSVLSYDPETGLFLRRSTGKPCSQVSDSTGYTRTYVDGKQYHCHRLAWVYMHGVWSGKGTEIDHINGIKTDNRIANLRLATRGQNATNSLAKKHSKTGLRGVHFHKGAGRYRAQIQKDGRMRSLGYFDTPEEAFAAYLSAAKEIHGPYVRT